MHTHTIDEILRVRSLYRAISFVQIKIARLYTWYDTYNKNTKARLVKFISMCARANTRYVHTTDALYNIRTHSFAVGLYFNKRNRIVGNIVHAETDIYGHFTVHSTHTRYKLRLLSIDLDHVNTAVPYRIHTYACVVPYLNHLHLDYLLVDRRFCLMRQTACK